MAQLKQQQVKGVKLEAFQCLRSSGSGRLPDAVGRPARNVQACSTYDRRSGHARLNAQRPAALMTTARSLELPRVKVFARPRPFNPLRRLSTFVSTPRKGTIVAGAALAEAAVAVEAPPATPRRLQPSQLSTPHPQLGQDLGFSTDFFQHYVLGDCLGQGSFGTVYLATSKETGEQLAVKVLPKEPPPNPKSRPGDAAAQRERVLFKLKREIQFLQRLQNRGNAVKLRGTFEDRCFVYVVMEACRGGDLESLLQDSALTEHQAALVMYECLQTVAECHANSILHGDIKPANFMLTQPLPDTSALDQLEPGSWLRAIDFGCAQQMTEGVPLTRKTGTPMFMAPEVYIGNYGKEADLWSCGMMLYQLISGRFPFWNSMDELRQTTLEEVMKAVIMKDIPLDYGPWAGMSPQGLALIRGLLERSAEDRLTAQEALEHPWFQMHGLGGQRGLARTTSANVIPFRRRMSEQLRLRLSARDLHRAQRSGAIPEAAEEGALPRIRSSGCLVQDREGLFATFG